jgi:hypothetical protein
MDNGYDVIALEEVCLNSILLMDTGIILPEIKKALEIKKYHLYITPLKRHNEYYGTTLYKVNVILTNTEKLEFNVEYHKNFFNTNCLIGRIPILFKDNINEKEKSIFINSNRNYQNKFVRKIDINDNIYTEIENAFIVRFNWTYMDVDNDICSTLFHGQPSLYKIKSNKKNLLIYNIHNKEIFITEKPQQIADLGPILINEKDYYNKDINKDINKNNLKYEIFKNIMTLINSAINSAKKNEPIIKNLDDYFNNIINKLEILYNKKNVRIENQHDFKDLYNNLYNNLIDYIRPNHINPESIKSVINSIFNSFEPIYMKRYKQQTEQYINNKIRYNEAVNNFNKYNNELSNIKMEIESFLTKMPGGNKPDYNIILGDFNHKGNLSKFQNIFLEYNILDVENPDKKCTTDGANTTCNAQCSNNLAFLYSKNIEIVGKKILKCPCANKNDSRFLQHPVLQHPVFNINIDFKPDKKKKLDDNIFNLTSNKKLKTNSDDVQITDFENVLTPISIPISISETESKKSESNKQIDKQSLDSFLINTKYKSKYLKYKMKYLNLKKIIESK